MFARNGFQNRRSQKVLSSSVPVPPEALPIIHEESTQNIQGGTTNEHYHLTAAELAFIQWAQQEPVYYEVLMDSTGEHVLDINGDVMMVRGPSYVAA